MSVHYDPVVRTIPIDRIAVLNPRDRGKKKFGQIVENIAKLGLKKPITVALAESRNGEKHYNLVCGQGRLEAYTALGEREIPAIIVEGDKEELLLMSLAENLARRKHSTVELVREIGAMRKRGYSNTQIAHKTDLDVTYVRGIILLLEKGEERLLSAVERGQLPLNIAMSICTADDTAVQRALQDAYERNDLRGKALIRTRRLIETRRTDGKKVRLGPRHTDEAACSSQTVLKTFQRETMRQRMVVHKAKLCETRLLFANSALRQLLHVDHFSTLLRAEGFDTAPAFLNEQPEGFLP